MATKFEAIYSAGVLRPLRALALRENEKVTLEIFQADDDREFMQLVHRQAANVEKLSIQEIRGRLKHIPGCWADDIIEQRSDDRAPSPVNTIIRTGRGKMMVPQVAG